MSMEPDPAERGGARSGCDLSATAGKCSRVEGAFMTSDKPRVIVDPRVQEAEDAFERMSFPSRSREERIGDGMVVECSTLRGTRPASSP